ncbi:hypothetical protein D3C81_1284120 [compost metagenome]
MSDGQRPAGFDLAVEQRNHRPGGAQHITKANHRETGFVNPGNFCIVSEQYRRDFTTERLKRQLRQALGTAHDISGPHRLIGRDQHKICYAGLQGSLSSIERPDCIVQHTLGDVVFDHGHMLVGGRMINRVDLPGFHHIEQFILVTYGPEYGKQSNRSRLSRAALLQL